MKNSVEYICALQRENQFYSGFHSEANLASTLIGRMVKRIQVGPYGILTQLFGWKITVIVSPCEALCRPGGALTEVLLALVTTFTRGGLSRIHDA